MARVADTTEVLRASWLENHATECNDICIKFGRSMYNNWLMHPRHGCARFRSADACNAESPTCFWAHFDQQCWPGMRLPDEASSDTRLSRRGAIQVTMRIPESVHAAT